jgi:PIN domain nuclease of toxin-antitoxin system
MILDTCALLWLAHDRRNLSDETLQKMGDVSILYISAITGFEIGLKYRMGKLILPLPPENWLEGILDHHDIAVIGLDMATCIKATELPPIHRDPCDRFIIATALLKRMPVVTADTRFSEYGVEVLR